MGMPEEQLQMMQQQQQPQPVTIDQVIQAYMQHAMSIQGDQMLNTEKKSQAMYQLAQALNVLVPLATQDGQAELQMKAESHQMDLQAKQAEMEFKQQEHVMKLQQAQEKHSLGLVMQQQKANVQQKTSKNSSETTV